MDSFNIDLFYVYLANMLVLFPSMRSYIDELYRTEINRFYSKARNNSYYGHRFMNDKSLEKDVSTKRAFGILLCSQDDENLQEGIISQIYEIYPSIQHLRECLTPENYWIAHTKHSDACDVKSSTEEEYMSFYFFLAYVITCDHGFETNTSPVLNTISEILQMYIKGLERIDHEGKIKILENVDTKKYTKVIQEPRKIFASIRNGKDLVDLATCMTSTTKDSPDVGNKILNKESALKEKCRLLQPLWEKDSSDFVQSLMLLHTFEMQLELNGFTLSELFSKENKIGSEERNLVPKIIASFFCIFDSNSYFVCKTSLLLTVLIFGQMAKMLKEAKDFYNLNNSEIQYSELGRLTGKNEALQEEVDKLNEIIQDKDRAIESLKLQLEAMRASQSKEVKKAQESLAEALAVSKSQVKSLEDRLEIERRHEVELYRLREFVFAIKSEIGIEEAKTPLKDLIAGKKIYIIGGRVDWRNKMKAAYPSLNLLDGYLSSLDEKLLLGADMVLLYTAHMSHTVYYKVMAMLKNNNIPFDYLGRANNIDLLENEIAGILQKQSDS